MLGLLALIGVTFATFSGQARIGARNFAQSIQQPRPDRADGLRPGAAHRRHRDSARRSAATAWPATCTATTPRTTGYLDHPPATVRSIRPADNSRFYVTDYQPGRRPPNHLRPCLTNIPPRRPGASTATTSPAGSMKFSYTGGDVPRRAATSTASLVDQTLRDPLRRRSTTTVGYGLRRRRRRPPRSPASNYRTRRPTTANNPDQRGPAQPGTA